MLLRQKALAGFAKARPVAYLPRVRAPLPRLSATPIRYLATAAPPSSNDPFANGTNAIYAEEMYKCWREDPKSVHASWAAYFGAMDKGVRSQDAFTPPPGFANVPQAEGGAPSLHVGQGNQDLTDHLKVRSKNFPTQQNTRLTVDS